MDRRVIFVFPISVMLEHCTTLCSYWMLCSRIATDDYSSNNTHRKPQQHIAWTLLEWHWNQQMYFQHYVKPWLRIRLINYKNSEWALYGDGLVYPQVGCVGVLSFCFYLVPEIKKTCTTGPQVTFPIYFLACLIYWIWHVLWLRLRGPFKKLAVWPYWSYTTALKEKKWTLIKSSHVLEKTALLFFGSGAQIQLSSIWVQAKIDWKWAWSHDLSVTWLAVQQSSSLCCVKQREFQYLP